jgi:hypothetical protein
MKKFALEDTLLYKKYKEDKKQIEENKWYLSEKAGKDVGWEKALLDWMLHHKKDSLKKTD